MKHSHYGSRHDPTRSFGYSQQDHYGRNQRNPSSNRETSQYEGMEFRDMDNDGTPFQTREPRSYRDHDVPGAGYRQEGSAYEGLHDEGYQDYRAQEYNEDMRSERYGRKYGEAHGGDLYRSDRYEAVWHPDQESEQKIERPIRSQAHYAQGGSRYGRRGRSDLRSEYASPSMTYNPTNMPAGRLGDQSRDIIASGPQTARRYGTERYGSSRYSDRPYSAAYGRSQSDSTSMYEDEVPNFRGKGPASYKRSDERISEELHECLTEHSGVDASEIDLQVEKGKVTLSGTVPDRWMKFQAEEIAERVKGVEEIDNKIRVEKNQLNLRPSEKEDSKLENVDENTNQKNRKTSADRKSTQH